MQKFYVNYSVDLGDKVMAMQAGPFTSGECAEQHRDDIKGYAGVSKCWIGETRDPERQLISA